MASDEDELPAIEFSRHRNSDNRNFSLLNAPNLLQCLQFLLHSLIIPNLLTFQLIIYDRKCKYSNVDNDFCAY